MEGIRRTPDEELKWVELALLFRLRLEVEGLGGTRRVLSLGKLVAAGERWRRWRGVARWLGREEAVSMVWRRGMGTPPGSWLGGSSGYTRLTESSLPLPTLHSLPCLSPPPSSSISNSNPSQLLCVWSTNRSNISSAMGPAGGAGGGQLTL